MRYEEHLGTLYGVLLSVSLGILAAGGAPGLLFTSDAQHYQFHVWTILSVGVLVFVVDSWLFYVTQEHLIRIGKPAEHDPLKPVLLGFLVMAMFITSFAPWQFVMRAWNHGYLFEWPQPANSVFTANLMAGVVCQLVIIQTAARRQEPEIRSAMLTQVRFVTAWRSMFLVALGLLIAFVFARNGPHDSPMWSMVIVVGWVSERVSEYGLWKIWESHRAIIDWLWEKHEAVSGWLVIAHRRLVALLAELLQGLGNAARRGRRWVRRRPHQSTALKR